MTYMADVPKYYPHTAERKYRLRRKFCHRGIFWNQEVTAYIERRLKETWSPEQISCTPGPVRVPSFRTIYRWLYEGYIEGCNARDLRRKGASLGKKETRGKFNAGKSIRRRDRSVYSRREAGHWELDTVVSGRGKSKACFATFAERKTRFYIAVKIPNRTADVMEAAIVGTLGQFPHEMVRTLTCDRGNEFANWRSIEERLGCPMYFADPYCAWQKGSNENSNGLLREFYPKGRNLSRVSEKTLKKNLELLNSRPKKVLGFRSPKELFEAELSILKCCT